MFSLVKTALVLTMSCFRAGLAQYHVKLQKYCSGKYVNILRYSYQTHITAIAKSVHSRHSFFFLNYIPFTHQSNLLQWILHHLISLFLILCVNSSFTSLKLKILKELAGCLNQFFIFLELRKIMSKILSSNKNIPTSFRSKLFNSQLE